MFTAIIIGVLALALVVGIIVSAVAPKRAAYSGDLAPRTVARLVTFGIAVVLAVVVGISSTAIIGARSVGIETVLGKYTRTLPNGFHITPPIAQIEEFPTTSQYLDVEAPVTFDGGGSGQQSLTVRWNIRADEAGALWEKFRSFENVRDQLIYPSAKDSVRAVFANYTPVDARSGDNVRKISEQILTDLQHTLADSGVDVESLSLTNTALDQTAQDALNRVIESEANVERAESRLTQAKIDAEADRERNKNVTEENLILECLTVTNNWSSEKNGPLPATWNCVGAESAGVLVSSK